MFLKKLKKTILTLALFALPFLGMAKSKISAETSIGILNIEKITNQI
jgi:hypothetical protein